MISIVLRLIGSLVVLLGVGILGVGYSNSVATSSVKPDLGFCFWLGPAIIALGTGSLFLQRWALLLLAVLSSASGLALGIGSVSRVPFPWELINLLIAVLLFLPGLIVWRWWQNARSGHSRKNG